MKKKHIVVIGLGGVGGYFGFKINKFNELSKEFHVTFIARSQTFRAIKENGLELYSPEFTDNVTRPDAILENISEIVKPDFVLICVKEYDLENVCNQLRDVLTKETILMPLMNGADVHERIRKIIPDNPVLPTCVYVASHNKAKGVVEHKGWSGKIITGKDEVYPLLNLDWVLSLFQKSHIKIDFQEKPLVAIWTKFILIASLGLVTAKYNSAFDIVCEDIIQKQEAYEIMEEVRAIAHKKGITLAPTIIETTFDKGKTFPPNTPSSLQLDVHLNKGGNELELIAGTLLRYGAELGIATPRIQQIYAEIKEFCS